MIWADLSSHVVSLDLGTLAGAFDIVSFFKNAKTYAIAIISAFIALLGVIALGVGATKFILRIIGDPQEAKRKHTWTQIILCLLGGGALVAAGAWGLITGIATAGAGTVQKLGEGAIDVEPLLNMLTMF